MSDLIDRDEAIMAVKAGALSAATLYGRTDEGSTALYETVRAIKAIPSAQPQRMRGKWIDTGSGQECSECGEIQYGYDSGRNFCPNCGADMRGDEDE